MSAGHLGAGQGDGEVAVPGGDSGGGGGEEGGEGEAKPSAEPWASFISENRERAELSERAGEPSWEAP